MPQVRTVVQRTLSPPPATRMVSATPGSPCGPRAGESAADMTAAAVAAASAATAMVASHGAGCWGASPLPTSLISGGGGGGLPRPVGTSGSSHSNGCGAASGSDACRSASPTLMVFQPAPRAGSPSPPMVLRQASPVLSGRPSAAASALAAVTAGSSCMRLPSPPQLTRPRLQQPSHQSVPVSQQPPQRPQWQFQQTPPAQEAPQFVPHGALLQSSPRAEPAVVRSTSAGRSPLRQTFGSSLVTAVAVSPAPQPVDARFRVRSPGSPISSATSSPRPGQPWGVATSSPVLSSLAALAAAAQGGPCRRSGSGPCGGVGAAMRCGGGGPVSAPNLRASLPVSATAQRMSSASTAGASTVGCPVRRAPSVPSAPAAVAAVVAVASPRLPPSRSGSLTHRGRPQAAPGAAAAVGAPTVPMKRPAVPGPAPVSPRLLFGGGLAGVSSAPCQGSGPAGGLAAPARRLEPVLSGRKAGGPGG